MDLSTSLHPSTLLRLNYSEINAQYRQLVSQNPTSSHVEAINDLLLHRIHIQALPPTFYDLWLPIALRNVPSLLGRALCDTKSAGVREAAIKRVTRLFHRPAWNSEAWDILGGAEGIAKIMEQIPVADVYRLAKAISRCGFSPDSDTRVACIEQLIERVQESGSSRPLFNALTSLYSLCGPDKVVDLVTNLTKNQYTCKLLARMGPIHPEIMRRVAVGTIDAPFYVRVSVIKSNRRALIDSPIPYSSSLYPPEVQEKLPSGMIFCLDLCHAMAADPKLCVYLPGQVDDVDLYVQAALRLAARKHLPFASIESFLAQLIQLPQSIWTDRPLDTRLMRELMFCWSISFYGKAGPGANAALKRIAHRDHPSRPGPEHQAALEDDLCTFLRRHQDPRLARDKDSWYFVDPMVEVLRRIAPSARGPFLEHVCRLSDSLCYEPGYDQFSFDAAVNPPREREKQVIPVWPYKIMDLLPAKTGQVLFDRMLIIHGCAGFLPMEDGSSSYALIYERQCQLQAKWEAEETRETAVGSQLFQDLQKRAERQRDCGERSVAAIAAIRVANATHSLEVWRMAVQWSKRFIRDTLVFPDLITDAILNADVFSCTEMPISRQPSSLSELRASVDSANEVLSTLREILVLSLREPMNHAHIKRKLPTFWSDLVAKRVRGIKRFRKAGLGTDSELVDTLLMPLISELVEWERFSVKEGFSWIFDEDDEPRPLRKWSFPAQTPPPPTVLHFLDELARQSDSVIQDYRKDWWPANEEVGEGFPRGLAVQQLLPDWDWFGFLLQHRSHAPYITSRVLDVLEASPEIVMAPVPNDDGAVNAYIDSMPCVIRGHLSLFTSKRSKNEALVQLWEKYAARREQYGVYFPVLQTLLISEIAEPMGLYAAARVIRPSRLPQATYLWEGKTYEATFKWNPELSAPRIDGDKLLPARDDRSLPENLLYLRLVGDEEDRYIYVLPKNRGLDVIHDPHWPWPNVRWSEPNRQLMRKISPAEREGCIISALLYLDSVATFTPSRIIPNVFPSSDCRRAPTMRLADEFAKNAQENDGEKGMRRALWVLGFLIKDVPALLLRNAAIVYLDSLQTLEKTDSYFAPIMRATFRLIRRLVQSDAPELAVDVVCRVIEDYADESTYQYHMKLPTLCSRVRPEAAAAFIQRFAGFVCNRLAEQKQQSKQKPSSETSNEQGKAFVKITTVKLLAQILGRANFLPVDTTVRIFRDLVNCSHHLDIRTAVVTATLNLFNHVTGAGADVLYEFLLELADIAAGPSETDPVSDKDTWTTSLPAVSSSRDRPMLSLLIKDAVDVIPPKRRAQYANEILVPLMNKSTAQHSYWMDIFLSSLNLSKSDPEISISDFGPFNPSMPDNILQTWAAYLPATFLKEYHRPWAMRPFHSHAAYEHITQALTRQNPAYRQTNSGLHWGDIVGLASRTNPVMQMDKFLFNRIEPKVKDGITVSAVAEEYKYRLAQLTRNPVEYNTKIHKFVVSTNHVVRALRRLRSNRAGSDDMSTSTREERYSLLDGIMLFVVQDILDISRTSDADTAPSILPSTLEIQALVLPSPVYNPKTQDKLQVFVAELSRLLRKWIEDPVLVLEFGVIETVTKEVPQEDAIALADMLAGEKIDLYSGSETEACLRGRLAKSLLDKVSLPDLNLSPLVRQMVEQWRKSRNHFVKRMGWEVLVVN
ncbi:hypothetical protein PHISCL_03416 [Aspergillus sclerotialis]|uniref:Uncharacterized protein n=1 Tax=Aspergillus sclerotialis TaxID=2070753 RepID=A0A3A2ZMM3_9EURO|nr:hypothetical protein PHISCL_03416 [Aspergillus sclerotialis]